MIRDISEIQKLAVKYNKPQLARMAQMGLIDPTKAVMAGMMIDRITKSNMQMPTETVADEALRPARMPYAGPQQNMPPVASAGLGAISPQPEMSSQMPREMMPDPTAGVTSLPSNIKDMADGGIVAFAGEGPSLVGPVPMTNEERLRQIKEKERLENEAKIAQEKKERGLTSAMTTGFEALDANARQNMATTIRQKLQNNIPLTPNEQGLMQRVPQFKSMVDAEMANRPQPASTFAPTSTQTLPPPPPPVVSRGQRQPTAGRTGKNQQAPVATDVTQQQAAPMTNQPGVAQEEPMGIASIIPKRPEPLDISPNLGKFTTTPFPVPGKKEIKDFLTEQQEADKQAGVNTNIYKDLMGDLDTKKGKLAGRKQEAIGNALMQTGIALLGARKGQEFTVLSESGQKSLQGLVFANEKIRETEDKIDDARRSLLVAENDYKRTRSDKALENVQKQRDKIEAMEIRNIEAQNIANAKTAEIQVQLFGKQVDLRGQEMQGYGYETQRASAADTERSRRAGALDVAREQSKSHLTGIELQGKNQLAVQRLQNIATNRPGETERMMAEHDRILRTQGPDAAENYLRLKERLSGSGKAQSTMASIADKAHDNVVARMKENPALASKLADPVAFDAAVTAEQNRIMKAYQQQPSGGALQKNPDGSYNYQPGK